jgi:hypothetical protein
MLNLSATELISRLLTLVIALTLHEYAHARVATCSVTTPRAWRPPHAQPCGIWTIRLADAGGGGLRLGQARADQSGDAAAAQPRWRDAGLAGGSVSTCCWRGWAACPIISAGVLGVSMAGLALSNNS